MGLTAADREGRVLGYLTKVQVDFVLKKDPDGIQMRLVQPQEFRRNGPKISFKQFDNKKLIYHQYFLAYLSKQMHGRMRTRFRRRGSIRKVEPPQTGRTGRTGPNEIKYKGPLKRGQGGERMGLLSGQKSADGVRLLYYPHHTH